MADSVRYMMEEMVPELEDFVKQKYFSKQEVKQIVKGRQDFEYLLKRKAALKEDYLRYIEYESKLEELRQHRKTALGEKGKKKTLADYAIVRRIHFIFERAVRKFKSDLSIWTAWLEFCRVSNSNRRLGRVVGRALQIHPTEPGLWVYAAAWEFEHNGNPSAARALMQQGLRMCKYSQKMWLDYFDMELMYVEKLVARRRILGLDVPQPQQPAAAAGQKRQRSEADSDQQHVHNPSSSSGMNVGVEEDGEGPESAAEAEAAAAEAAGNYLQQQQQQQQGRPDDQADQVEDSGLIDLDPQAAVTAVLSGAVARLVFQNAIKAHAQKTATNSSSNYLKPKAAAAAAAASGSSSGLGFRAGFLEVLGKYMSPGVEGLRQEILDSIREDFPQDPAAADLLARSAGDPTDLTASQEDVQAALQHYEQMLVSGPLTAAAGVAAANGNYTTAGLGQNKRRKTSQQQAIQPPQQHQGRSREAAVQLYRLYSRYLSDHLNALQSDESKVSEAAAAAQQLFKVFVRAHEAGAADLELYQRWVELAGTMGQYKVALKASRLACEAYPSNAAAWHTRITLEQQSPSIGSKVNSSSSSNSDELLILIKQGLQQVPAADAGQLWQQAFELCSSNPSEMQQLRQLLLTAVTHTAVKGPPAGGLGATVGMCLATVWTTPGPDAARELFKKLLLLPPAGGDMFRTMIELESGRYGLPSGLGSGLGVKGLAGSDNVGPNIPQKGVKLTDGAVQRVRAVYDAWAAAYGGVDVELWVQYALFEQQNSRQGPGKVYHRAVKALQDPDALVQQYRSRVGLV